MFLRQIQNVTNQQKILCNNIKDKYPIIMLYGAGGMLISTLTALKRYGLIATCICDDNPRCKMIYGLPVYTYIEFKQIYTHNNYYIFISNANHVDQIYHKLILNKETAPIIRGFFANDIYDTEQTNYDFILDNLTKFEEVYASLEDKYSQQVLINLLNFKLSGDIKYIEQIYTNNNYFNNDVITLNHNEIYVDAGAFDGDSILDFLKTTQNQYSHIFAFEPDQNNIIALKDRLTYLEKITIYPIGLWNKQDTLNFVGSDNECSVICMEGNSSIHVNSLDNIIKQPVTFIKMDIEGAELNAIYGATSLIQTYKPKLAICLYHRRTDIFNILLTIKLIRQDYRFYLRHHSMMNTDTILYAI